MAKDLEPDGGACADRRNTLLRRRGKALENRAIEPDAGAGRIVADDLAGPRRARR